MAAVEVGRRAVNCPVLSVRIKAQKRLRSTERAVVRVIPHGVSGLKGAGLDHLDLHVRAGVIERGPVSREHVLP